MRLLGESDIYCLPSDSEAFCTAVLEAIACKCYIITTERGGIKELITEKHLGTIMKDNSEDTVYHALEEALANDEKCRLAIAQAYIKLVENYTWDKTAEHFRTVADKMSER